jgi:hypothetical protein
MVTTDRKAKVAAGKAPAPSGEQIWRTIRKRSFAVLSYVTPTGEPRSSGVLYAATRDRLYVAVAPDSWKALHIPATDQVAVTVPVRRGGLLALLFAIPPATISFHARAVVHPRGALDAASLSSELATLVPAERLSACRIVEIFPEGQFLTYGIGTSLRGMRDPATARAHVPVS